MNKEDVIRMAREAGILEPIDLLKSNQWQQDTIRELERFAALVAAHVRETEFKPDWNNYRQGLADGAAEEREACAMVCDAEARMHESLDVNGRSRHLEDAAVAKTCAAAIRARNQ